MFSRWSMLRGRWLRAYRASRLARVLKSVDTACEHINPFLCAIAVALACSYMLLAPVLRYGEQLGATTALEQATTADSAYTGGI